MVPAQYKNISVDSLQAKTIVMRALFLKAKKNFGVKSNYTE